MSNRFEKKEKSLAQSVISAGKEVEEEIVAEENQQKDENNNQIKIENEETESNIKIETIQEDAMEESESTITQEEEANLFSIKKKEKINKKQKIYYLKESNIRKIKKWADKAGMKESELIDFLIEQSVKILKVR